MIKSSIRKVLFSSKYLKFPKWNIILECTKIFITHLFYKFWNNWQSNSSRKIMFNEIQYDYHVFKCLYSYRNNLFTIYINLNFLILRVTNFIDKMLRPTNLIYRYTGKNINTRTKVDCMIIMYDCINIVCTYASY